MPDVINPLKGKTGAQLEAMRLEKATELNTIFETSVASAADGTKTYDLTVDQLTDVQARHKELNDIGAARDAQIAVEKIATDAKSLYADLSAPRRPAFPTGQHSDDRAMVQKSVARQFVESKQFTSYLSNRPNESDVFETDISLKVLMTTTTGWTPETTRSGLVVPFVTRPLQVTDVIPTISTDQVAYTFMQETTFTNAAAETAEGAVKPEAALALTPVTSPVRKIAVWIPVTDEQLEDVAGIQSYVEQRLAFMVRQRLDTQILIGNGIAPNLLGIVSTPLVQVQPLGGDPEPDAIYKAMTLIRTSGALNGGAVPSAVIMNPTDWQAIRLLTTAVGGYMWGPPMDTAPERIWGLPVVLAEGLTAGTAIVGDFQNFSLLVEKKQMTIKVGFQNDDFIRNQRSIVAEIRVAFLLTRPAAFCLVTGL